jgi:integrase/recombinase XerD
MSPLRETLDEYLAMRRALGHKLCRAGRLLQQFVAFADLAGATYVTTDLALAWVGQPCGAALAERARRLGIVRRFAQYCGALDSRTIVPPQGLLPHRYQRPTPYIYRDEEISRLLDAAQQLSSSTGLRPHTYSTLFGLYAVTGMRCREPLQLDRDDVDLVNGVLTIRGAKFGKSRYVPLHVSSQCE